MSDLFCATQNTNHSLSIGIFYSTTEGVCAGTGYPLLYVSKQPTQSYQYAYRLHGLTLSKCVQYIGYSKPSINFCGGQMRPHATHPFIIPTSPARIFDERWVPFSSFFNAGDNQIDIHVNPSPSDIDEWISLSINGDAVTLCNYRFV